MANCSQCDLQALRILDYGAVPGVSRIGTLGTFAAMSSSENIPDEVPVADAAEQQQPAVDAPLDDEEALEADEYEPPLEASSPDWQEQREDAVVIDPELDEFDRG